MAIPKISDLSAGQQTFDHDDAKWGPLACTTHAESNGFAPDCGSCTETARLAIEHVRAVDAEKARL